MAARFYSARSGSVNGRVDPASGAGRDSAAMICLTFDNLGGIAEGLAPDPKHPALAIGLTRILELLSKLEIRATFFVEGYAAEAFPEAVRSIDDAGHEVALHAWKHERWDQLDPDSERELLARGVSALRELLGRAPEGFRPPGGRLTDASREILPANGIRYVSTAEGESRGLPGHPFTWKRVDAFSLIPRFGGRDLPAAYFEGWLREALAHEARTPKVPWLAVAHPFCSGLDPCYGAFQDFATRLRESLDARAFRSLGSA